MTTQTSSESLAALVGELVRIESTNPTLPMGGAGEAEVARFIADWCEAAGLEVEVTEVEPGRPNVVAAARGSGGGKSLILNGHIDTVGTIGMEDPFSGRIEDGRLYGRGSYDMKSGVAAAMSATAACLEHELAGDVVLTAVIDEEMECLGTTALLKTLTADGAIVVEPTDMTLGIAHKGFAAYEIETLGNAAHGGQPEVGIDANVRMGHVLLRIEELNAKLAAGREHALLGPGSLHASVLEGGQERTSYSGRSTLRGGRRTLPGDEPAEIEAELAELLGDLPGSSGLGIWKAPFEIDAEHPFVSVVQRASGEQLGGLFYWAETALFDAADIPAVLLGPKGDGAHAEVEWVDIDSVHRCFEHYVAVACAFCA